MTCPHYTPEVVKAHVEHGLSITDTLHEAQFLRNDIYEQHQNSITIEHAYYKDQTP